MMATLIYADGTRKDVQPRNKKRFSLDEAQELIGTDMITVMPARKLGMVLLGDDNGKLFGAPVNEEASKLYRYPEYDFLVGTILYCRAAEFI